METDFETQAYDSIGKGLYKKDFRGTIGSKKKFNSHVFDAQNL